ncbi:hypothetical protein [Amycolatopsis sp. PS_44_ISF1]|uniref:hypothetical protein n=1 Tax=Amycolatopsis sp. PS_44_ISF1 TaxID=2974917 RepID=UPI0028DF0A44|nr:hypothetical protein [Amycolatopsis sp. PS_44_ISF1]MDT8914781.1 hypothetical protein [Amycolatopsis sp. PS_44_ISF1]
MKLAAVAGMAVVLLLGTTACDNGTPAANDGGGAAATSELNGIQSTLDGIDSDMARDGSP